jgi:hypothetical protein
LLSLDHGIVSLLDALSNAQLDDETGRFKADPRFQFQHPYPATKIMFIPDKVGSLSLRWHDFSITIA